ncbi:MAG: acyl-CoA dehydrogenase family protein [Chloroflexi bacterium]|nr:acyl-CoA dehydrogenase family protein [Chloroflexota bacterium]
MERIRSEIRETVAAVLPPDWQGTGFLPMDVRPEHFSLARELDKRLAARRLLAPAWPEELGGRGLTPYEQFALYEELGFALAPRLTAISVDLVAPVLLLYGSDIVETDDLTVPHPRLSERSFVLVPLADIAPDVMHPVSGKTVTEMLASVDGKEGVRLWGELPR